MYGSEESTILAEVRAGIVRWEVFIQSRAACVRACRVSVTSRARISKPPLDCVRRATDSSSSTGIQEGESALAALQEGPPAVH